MAILTDSWLIDIFITFSIISMIFILYTSRNYNYWRKQGVVQITPIPVFGNFFQYWIPVWNQSPGSIIKKFYDENRDQLYVGFYAFDKACLLLIDENIIKNVLVRSFTSFSDKFMRSSERDLLSNRSLPFLKYVEWNNLRRKITPAFSPAKLKNDIKYLEEVTKDLDNHLDALGLEGSGNSIDVKEILAKYTTDMSGLIGFGLKLNSLRDPEAEFRKYGKMMFGNYTAWRSLELSAIYLTPPWIKNIFNFCFFEKRSGEFFKKEFEKIFSHREASGIFRNDLVDLLIYIKNNDATMSLDDIISQAIVLFTAGFDTTSTVMAFCLYELAGHLDIQKKLRTEIIDALEKTDGVITYEMVCSLPFLECVVAETLRLHPTVPTVDRIATHDFIIEETGLKVPVGTPIFISLTGLHYDSRIFTNPEIFDPENFSSHNGSKNPAYMPFGTGPRSCIAFRQGLMHVKYGIIHMISKYYFKLSASSSVEVDPKVYFTSGKEGLYLHLEKIHKS